MYYNILCIVFTWQSRQGNSCMTLCGARADDIPPSKARFFLAVKKMAAFLNRRARPALPSC